MDIKQAIQLAKGTEDKKVGFNLQIPLSLKTQFERFCKKNGVKMTAMLTSLMQIAISADDKDYEIKHINSSEDCTEDLKIHKRLLLIWREEINKELDEMYAYGNMDKDDVDYELQQRASKLHNNRDEINKVLGV